MRTQKSKLFMFLALLLTIGLPLHAVSIIQLKGGNTAVTLAPSFLSALQGLQITPSILCPATLQDGPSTIAKFPVVSGVLSRDSFAGTISHSGGLALTQSPGSTVYLYDFNIDTAASILSGTVFVDNGRQPLAELILPLFNLKLNSLPQIKGKCLTINNVTLTLTAQAAAALSKVFSVQIPAGLLVGTANVKACILRCEDKPRPCHNWFFQ